MFLAKTLLSIALVQSLCRASDLDPRSRTCANLGVRWAYYNNTSGMNVDGDYSTFLPEEYKTVKPVYTSRTARVGGFEIGNYKGVPRVVRLYHSPREFISTYFVLNHRAYIYAEESGAYIFNISNVDDIMFLWLGDNAYSGWTRANADIVAAFSVNPCCFSGSGSTSYVLAQGEYLPFRIIFAQAQGGAFGDITITSPNGTVILGSHTQPSRDIVKHGCVPEGSRQLAPRFPHFGKET